MPVRIAASGKEVHDYEFDIVYPDGTMRHLLGDARPLRDDQGNPRGAVAAFIDITERKKAEIMLKETLDNLEKLVEERTEELKTAFNSLKESEQSLSEAQKLAHIGNWKWDIVTDEAYWSDEMYSIYGLKPQEFEVTSVLHQLDQKIIYPHYDFKHLTEKYFEIGMKLDDFLIQLVKYCTYTGCLKTILSSTIG